MMGSVAKGHRKQPMKAPKTSPLCAVTPGTVATRLLCPWDFPGKRTAAGCSSAGDLPDPGIKLVSATLQAYSLPSGPLGCSSLCLFKFVYHFLNFYFILGSSSFIMLC